MPELGLKFPVFLVKIVDLPNMTFVEKMLLGPLVVMLAILGDHRDVKVIL